MEKLSRMVVKLSVALAVATCLLSGTANAQPLLKGTFTLPYDVRWGGTLVPAGQYKIVIDSAHRPALVSTLSGTGMVFATPQIVNEASRGDKTALTVPQAETERTFRALTCREGTRSLCTVVHLRSGVGRPAQTDRWQSAWPRTRDRMRSIREPHGAGPEGPALTLSGRAQGQAVECRVATALRRTPSGPRSCQVRRPNRNVTLKAFSTVPGGNSVGCPRSRRPNWNRLSGPIGMITAAALSFW